MRTIPGLSRRVNGALTRGNGDPKPRASFPVRHSGAAAVQPARRKPNYWGSEAATRTPEARESVVRQQSMTPPMSPLDASTIAKLLVEFGQRTALRGGNPYRARAY